MDLYINAQGAESNKKRATETFIEAARSSMEDLKIRALVKDVYIISLSLLSLVDGLSL